MGDIDVELRGVTKRFGSVTAVNNVSFHIKKGEFFSLLGPSGCGKTTILRMVSGFETPTEGVIEIGGEDMSRRVPFKRPTNLVFQHLALFPHLSVYKNIAFGLEMKGFSKSEIRKRVDEMFDLIQLQGYAERKISQLSGGQKQRIAIARALVNHPTVLLLDEPLGALDLKLREQMQLELKRIQREVGTTFVYVTHDQKEAITMSNSIAVMNNGIVEQIGDAGEIYENPRTVFVANFIGETNLFDGTVSSNGNGAATVDCAGLAVKVAASGAVADGQRASVSVRPEKIRIGAGFDGIANCYDGVVEDVVYQGSTTSYRIRVGGGREVNVAVQNTERSDGYAPGARIKVGWEPEKGVLIPERAP